MNSQKYLPSLQYKKKVQLKTDSLSVPFFTPSTFYLSWNRSTWQACISLNIHASRVTSRVHDVAVVM